MVAYLGRIVGMGRLDLAEDIVQDTLCLALEMWPVHGLPDNPSAWLMRVGRNKAIDLLRRDTQFRFFTPELTHILGERDDQPDDLSALETAIQDDQLRMMLACCHPELSTEAQVTLVLKTLCGFSVSEIAHALLTSPDAIEKRLGRARKIFRQHGTYPEVIRGSDVAERLEAVYQAIYLLFNEGYHSSHAEHTVREDLCSEAIRLAPLVSEHPEGDKPKTHALLALLCLHAARLRGRLTADGDLIQLDKQDRSKWDHELIQRGYALLAKASSGDELSEYHLEAAIASIHCAAPTYQKTDWSRIVELYDVLYRLKPSPIVALNRAIAAGEGRGPHEGLAELRKIRNAAKLKDYPFYAAAYGEFHLRAGHLTLAATHFEKALSLARSRSETVFFDRKLRACGASPEATLSG